jgi:hypothetical protein
VRLGLTFVLVHIGWLMFREQDLRQLADAFRLNPVVPAPIWEAGLFLAGQAALYSVPLWIWPLVEKAAGPEGCRLPAPQRWTRVGLDAAAGALLVAGVLILTSPTAADFIYFQF